MQNESNPERHWGQFAETLGGIVRTFPPVPDVISLVQADGTSPRRAELSLALSAWDRLYEPRMLHAIEQFLEQRAWPELEPRVSALLCARLQAAFAFAVQLVEAGPHPESSMLTWPAHMTYPDVMAWLLTDWWHRHGREAYVVEWQANQYEAQFSSDDPLD